MNEKETSLAIAKEKLDECVCVVDVFLLLTVLYSFDVFLVRGS